jgi:hypothetical protein
MTLRILAILALLVVANVAYAQEKGTEHQLVTYDPLFWKDQLSLKTAQSRKIAEINREFYEGLRRLKQVSYSKSEMQEQLNQGLQERSVKIWATLHGKQKRKLEKILEANALQGP